jgi:hypothetical protein
MCVCTEIKGSFPKYPHLHKIKHTRTFMANIFLIIGNLHSNTSLTMHNDMEKNIINWNKIYGNFDYQFHYYREVLVAPLHAAL